MEKRMELKKVAKVVEQVLRECPQTRNSDDLLYIKVCEYMTGGLLSMPFAVFMKNRKELGAPAFETVRRTRQKLQHDNPYLSSDAEVQQVKKALEDQYMAYARGL